MFISFFLFFVLFGYFTCFVLRGCFPPIFVLIPGMYSVDLRTNLDSFDCFYQTNIQYLKQNAYENMKNSLNNFITNMQQPNDKL